MATVRGTPYTGPGVLPPSRGGVQPRVAQTPKPAPQASQGFNPLAWLGTALGLGGPTPSARPASARVNEAAGGSTRTVGTPAPRPIARDTVSGLTRESFAADPLDRNRQPRIRGAGVTPPVASPAAAAPTFGFTDRATLGTYEGHQSVPNVTGAPAHDPATGLLLNPTTGAFDVPYTPSYPGADQPLNVGGRTADGFLYYENPTTGATMALTPEDESSLVLMRRFDPSGKFIDSYFYGFADADYSNPDDWKTQFNMANQFEDVRGAWTGQFGGVAGLGNLGAEQGGAGGGGQSETDFWMQYLPELLGVANTGGAGQPYPEPAMNQVPAISGGAVSSQPSLEAGQNGLTPELLAFLMALMRGQGGAPPGAS